MTTINKIFLVANVALFLAFDWFFLRRALPLQPSPGWEYKDLISALLTVVTIILAFIGLVVALAAVWGWQTISSGAAKEATKASTEQTDVHLQSDEFKGKLRLLILEQLENINKAKVQDEVVVDAAQDAPPNAPEADEEWKD